MQQKEKFVERWEQFSSNKIRLLSLIVVNIETQLKSATLTLKVLEAINFFPRPNYKR